MAKTKVEIKDTKYGRMFTIWKVLGVTAEGRDITPERSEIQFGIKKAKLILEHEEDLKLFVEEFNEDNI